MCDVSLCSQSCSGAVHLEVARFKAGVQYSQRSQVKCFFVPDVLSCLLFQNIDLLKSAHLNAVQLLLCCNLTIILCETRSILSYVLSRVKTLTVPP